MIFHKLVFRHLKYGDDKEFTFLQAQDTIRWLEKNGITLGPGTAILDLGCGRGIIGAELSKKGCDVILSDEFNSLLPEYGGIELRIIDIDKDDLKGLGTYDLVICSNVIEHISRPERFIQSVDGILKPGGRLYLSWTNWLSPWGGHEFSPFHYFGPRLGPWLYDTLVGRPRKHFPHENLFPLSIGGTIRLIRGNSHLRVIKVIPRYYPELEFITRIPGVREFLTWNCVILLEKAGLEES